MANFHECRALSDCIDICSMTSVGLLFSSKTTKSKCLFLDGQNSIEIILLWRCILYTLINNLLCYMYLLAGCHVELG